MPAIQLDSKTQKVVEDLRKLLREKTGLETSIKVKFIRGLDIGAYASLEFSEPNFKDVPAEAIMRFERLPNGNIIYNNLKFEPNVCIALVVRREKANMTEIVIFPDGLPKLRTKFLGIPIWRKDKSGIKESVNETISKNKDQTVISKAFVANFLPKGRFLSEYGLVGSSPGDDGTPTFSEVKL